MENYSHVLHSLTGLTLDAKNIDWPQVRRILVVKLRSIGDTVLATPSLIALRRFLPEAQIDILLEDWVAPLLEGFGEVDNVIEVGPGNFSRLAVMRRLRHERYDVAFNLHGGTTSAFFTFASGATHRIGYAEYQYSFLYNHLYSSALDFWKKPKTHSAEQQLALLGFAGVPVEDRPKSRLAVSQAAVDSLELKLRPRLSQISDLKSEIALLHPAAAFATKQWAAENFASVAEYLKQRGLQSVAVVAKNEHKVLENLKAVSRVPIVSFDDLTLTEITALASRAKIFVGNDSGIAHIAAAVSTPTVVIFGSSNRDHWRPWTEAPNEIVFEEFACQPCPGYECKEFGEPRCILSVTPESVIAAIDRVLGSEMKKDD
ncbi:MAG: glycosyltransferase family 9 protein [Acidobacteria bacterium]|nr:glycosyltransferase family 9 protein [Acidobacteriota bacterium]